MRRADSFAPLAMLADVYAGRRTPLDLLADYMSAKRRTGTADPDYSSRLSRPDEPRRY